MLQIIIAMLIANSSPNAVPAQELAPMIIWLSKQYQVDAELVTRIVLIESKGVAGAYNKRTNDYGLMQLNGRTMQAYGINKKCALNWKCNLESGIRILSDMSDHTGYRACMYNLGPKGRFKRYLLPCESYERKLTSID